jgi:DNA mismatch repair protein MutL
VLFENLKKKSSAFGGSSQKLLIPETIELGYSETVLLEKMIADLKNLGLEIEPFGGNTFVVKALPSILSDKEVKPLILEMLDRMEELGFVPDSKRPGFEKASGFEKVSGVEKAPGVEKAIDECLILMACHGSIRAHQALSQQEMKGLLNQLDQCDNPSHCPHGRPTWIRWTVKELEKSFNRIV